MNNLIWLWHDSPLGFVVFFGFIGWAAYVIGMWLSRGLDWYLARRQSRKEYAALIRTQKALDRKNAGRSARSMSKSGAMR